MNDIIYFLLCTLPIGFQKGENLNFRRYNNIIQLPISPDCGQTTPVKNNA